MKAEQSVEQLQNRGQEDELAAQITKLRKLRQANAQLKAQLEAEQATNKHNTEAFEEHKLAVAELYEKLRQSEQEQSESKEHVSQLQKDNKRFKRLIKQLTERLKQCKQELEDSAHDSSRQMSEKQKEVNSLQSRLDKQIEVAQASNGRLACLSMSTCILTTLQLLSAGAVSVKAAQGQRPVFFPLIRQTEADAVPLTTQQLHYRVNLLHTLALELLCQSSNRLTESGGVCHHLITYRPPPSKASADSSYYTASRLLLALYVLSVQPLLQQLSASVQSLTSTEDRDYLLLQLDSLLYKLRQPTLKLQQKVLYLTECRQENTGCGTLELSSLSLLSFLNKLTETLRGSSSNFVAYVQPEAVAKRVSECISGNSSSSWFTECLRKTAAAVLKDVPAAEEKYPNLYAARRGDFETDKQEIIKQIKTQLQCLHTAALKSNVMVWNSVCCKLDVMCKNRDLSFIDQHQLISIIQIAQRNTLLNTQILEVIHARLSKRA